jgi:biotin operon repressor
MAHHKQEQLVSIESQAEFDLLSGKRFERLFLKMYVAARTSGLLAVISDRDWKTLCVMATYMDKDGYCFPSQEELAPALGCSRQMVSERVNSLARFRFHGQPVFLVVKGKHTKGGTWARNGYRVLPIANLEIFGNKKEQSPAQPTAQQKNEKNTVSSPTGTVQLDTNYIKYTNKISFSNIRRENNEEKQ